MRTRSSRFFVILLHLVGVSHRDWMSDYASGIVGVQPWPVSLEQIDLFNTDQVMIDHTISTTGSKSSRIDKQTKKKRRLQRRRHPLETEQQPPVWLQDNSDGTCLGPTGKFTECGDATLWFVERKKLPSTNKLKLLAGSGAGSSIFGGGSKKQGDNSFSKTRPTTGLTFQVLDRDYEASLGPPSVHTGVPLSPPAFESWRQRRARRKAAKQGPSECLEAGATKKGAGGRRNTDEDENDDAAADDGKVEIQSCRSGRGFVWQSRAHSAIWVVTEEGVLQPMDTPSLCLSRSEGTTQAVLGDCSSPVKFSFLRYRAVPVTVAVAHGAQSDDEATSHESAQEQERVTSATASTSTSSTIPSTTTSSQSLPVHRDRASSHASDPATRPELKLASRPQFTDHKQNKKNSPAAIHKRLSSSPFGVLSDTNPILLVGGNNRNGRGGMTPPPSASLAHPTGKMGDGGGRGGFMRSRMQTHPYLDAANNGIWTCPQTGLEYHTDLGRYLGHDRKEKGRHTLTGVGLYRKGYVIKVYGVAFYVTKRDVLADPSFEPYTSHTADHLRERPDFYTILQKMGNAESGSNARLFDRTIMLKTNMQLSTDTMRSCLQADWSYLTEEMKTTLVDSSMRPRPADDDMLSLIQSPDNPSRCSCSQTAPPEYSANPECCARGTELAFTWLKSNHLEVRLNGRLMERFPRPEIAEGIFYEYLRHDDPISPELRDRVVDGFPFLLAPLAQVRGVHIGKNAHTKGPAHVNAFVKAIGGFAGAVTSQVVEMAGMARRGTAEAAEHAGNAARAFGEAAKDFGREVDRRRDLMVKHTVNFPGTAMKLLSRDEETIHAMSRWISGFLTKQETPGEVEVIAVEPTKRHAPRGRVFGYPVARWFGEEYHAPDEIGPMKFHPTINKIILALVHLYLLLLFIMSFPGSYSTRTKFVIRKSISDSESDTSDEFDKSYDSPERATRDRNSYSRRTLLARAREALRPSTTAKSDELPDDIGSNSGSPLKKKSLSYFL